MSLDWNTKDCIGNGLTSGWIEQEDIDPENPHRFIHPVTNSLAWGAFCGFHISEVTVQNIDEVIWRVKFLERINRPWMADNKFPTVEEIDSHIGFRTNCDTKTRKQWLAFQIKCLSDEVTKEVDNLYTSEEHVEAVNT